MVRRSAGPLRGDARQVTAHLCRQVGMKFLTWCGDVCLNGMNVNFFTRRNGVGMAGRTQCRIVRMKDFTAFAAMMPA